MLRLTCVIMCKNCEDISFVMNLCAPTSTIWPTSASSIPEAMPFSSAVRPSSRSQPRSLVWLRRSSALSLIQDLRKASWFHANPVTSNFLTMTLRACVSCALSCITRALAPMPLVWRDLKDLLSSLISMMYVRLRKYLL